MAGQSPDQFPHITLREHKQICAAGFRRDERLAWLAATFMVPAYHNPKGMPEDPLSQTGEKFASSKADEAYVRAYLKSFSR